MHQRDGLPAALAWGMLAAWAVHDAEELLTMPGWLERASPRLRARLPRVAQRWSEHLRITRSQARIAIAAMGALIAVAAARGARTGGRSRLFQLTLMGFGLHAGGHVAQAAVTGGYTPGAVTAPLFVAPYAVWAWRRLPAAGLATRPGRDAVVSAVLMPTTAVACHTLARRVAPRPEGPIRC